MYLINQDRDQIIQKTQPLFTAPKYRTSVFNGHTYKVSTNLYHGDLMVGSFDNVTKANAEMARISKCTDELVFVGGYHHGEDFEIIEALISELEGGYENQ